MQNKILATVKLNLRWKQIQFQLSQNWKKGWNKQQRKNQTLKQKQKWRPGMKPLQKVI